MEELSLEDPSVLLEAASEFALYPGVQNDESVKNLLDRFPLPLIFSALQNKSDVPGLESTLLNCLERIFRTKYGASLIPQYTTFIQVGLSAESQSVRCLACKAVSCLLDNDDKVADTAAQLVIDHGLYASLLDLLTRGDELVAAASTNAIKSLASFPKGIDVIFPANVDESTHLRNVAANCSSLGRVRVMALIVKLFSVSSSVASRAHNSNLLNLLEAEVDSKNDMLTTLSVLELLYELSEIPHAAEFLSRSTLLQLLTTLISDASVESILRSRAIMISARLLSSEDVKAVLEALDSRLESLKGQDADECETALEALGEIGSSNQGAVLLLSSSSPVARHVVEAAFDRQGRGAQLAALHALGNISGENRSDHSKLLNDTAEECLRRIIYDTAGESPKLTPSGLFLSVLRQDSEVRLAAYRLLTGLVARQWCLQQICSKQEIIDIVTDPHTESTKNGMEARYNCCKSIYSALSALDATHPSLIKIATKLQEAVRRGPYLSRDRMEAQPTEELAAL
ncbi:hypothetical protein C5167_019320 [Papaver somniferum]|uniref:26S proteasome non-ATPase regulatory subunit 5 n=1 Tax=Papaver somniferum TaxID=3469 RepID=A0A4Y7IQE9_PAPSO|nr:hypothetical protein C5167_019320 [Papaver somniferum]